MTQTHKPTVTTTPVVGLSRVMLFRSLGAAERGLSSEEARQRQQHYGKNQITFHRARSPLLMLIEEFTALFPLLLLAAALLSFFAQSISPGEGYELIGFALLFLFNDFSASQPESNHHLAINSTNHIGFSLLQYLNYTGKQGLVLLQFVVTRQFMFICLYGKKTSYTYLPYGSGKQVF